MTTTDSLPDTCALPWCTGHDQHSSVTKDGDPVIVHDLDADDFFDSSTPFPHIIGAAAYADEVRSSSGAVLDDLAIHVTCESPLKPSDARKLAHILIWLAEKVDRATDVPDVQQDTDRRPE